MVIRHDTRFKMQATGTSLLPVMPGLVPATTEETGQAQAGSSGVLRGAA